MTVGLLPGCRLGFVPGGGGWSGSACVGMPHLLEVTCHGSRFY